MALYCDQVRTVWKLVNFLRKQGKKELGLSEEAKEQSKKDNRSTFDLLYWDADLEPALLRLLGPLLHVNGPENIIVPCVPSPSLPMVGQSG